MIRTLVTEAVVVAQRMIRTLLTEAVVGSVRAKSMVRVALAELRRGNEPEAKPMDRIPATETTSVNRSQHGFGAATTAFD